MLKFLKNLFTPTMTKEEIAYQYSIWAWGKKVPTDLDGFADFFLEFLEEKGIDVNGKKK